MAALRQAGAQLEEDEGGVDMDLLLNRYRKQKRTGCVVVAADASVWAAALGEDEGGWTGTYWSTTEGEQKTSTSFSCVVSCKT
jgi:hypothetical protein